MARTIVLPSNPADIKAIRDAIKEADDCLIHIDSEREQVKAIVDMVNEKYELPKSFVSKMINVYHKSNYDKLSQEQSDFAELYEKVVK